MPDGSVWSLILPGLPAAVLGLVGGWIAARLNYRRDAGELALKIAQEARTEVAQLGRWQRSVMRWWPRHERYDMALQAELTRLDPTAEGRIPKAPPAPIWGTDDSSERN